MQTTEKRQYFYSMQTTEKRQRTQEKLTTYKHHQRSLEFDFPKFKLGG